MPVKTVTQQDIKALCSVRHRYVTQRTATANQLRGLVAEYGVIFSLSLAKLRLELPEALDNADNAMSPALRTLLRSCLSELLTLDSKITALEQQLRELCKALPAYQALLTVPGFGPIIAAALVSEVGRG